MKRILFDKKKEGEGAAVNIMASAQPENPNTPSSSSGANPADLTPVINAIEKGFQELGKIITPKAAEPAKAAEAVLPTSTPPAAEPAKKKDRWFDEFDPGL